MKINLNRRFTDVESADVGKNDVTITLQDGTEIYVRHFKNTSKSLKPHSHSTVQIWEKGTLIWSVRVGHEEEAE